MKNYKFVRQLTRPLVSTVATTELKEEKVVLKNGREFMRKVPTRVTKEVPVKLTKYDLEISRTDTTITYKHYSSKSYEQVVEDLIRIRYTANSEFAILRQKEVKQEEYTAYYVYCEECKSYAKQLIAERKNAIGI